MMETYPPHPFGVFLPNPNSTFQKFKIRLRRLKVCALLNSALRIIVLYSNKKNMINEFSRDVLLVSNDQSSVTNDFRANS